MPAPERGTASTIDLWPPGADNGGMDGDPAGRLRTVGGTMQISSPPGGPTVITVRLPSHT
jgi:hypothetical protein